MRVNCSCGNADVDKIYGVFVTWPLREGDNLASVAAANNLTRDLVQRYNPYVNFNSGKGIVYIPGKGLVVSIVDPQPGESIIDCCAAPGGKTLLMASRLNGQGMVSAIDINEGRLRILKETAKSHCINNVITTVHSDLREISSTKLGKSDKVLLDAPCSGLGVLSKIKMEPILP